MGCTSLPSPGVTPAPCRRPTSAQFLRHDDESPLKATDFGLSIRHWPDEPKLTSRSGRRPSYPACWAGGRAGCAGSTQTHPAPSSLPD